MSKNKRNRMNVARSLATAIETTSSVIDVQPNVVESPAEPAEPAQPDAGSGLPPPDEPLYKCTVTVFPKKMTLSDVEPPVATVACGQLLVDQHQVRPKDRRAPGIRVVMTPGDGWSATRVWSKWRDRAGAGVLWVVLISFLFGERGVVGQLLDLVGAGSWEPYAVAALLAAMLVVLGVRGATGGLLAALYITFFPVVAFFLAIGAVWRLTKIVRAFQNFAFSGANWLVMAVCCAVTAKSSNVVLLNIACAYLIFGAAYLITANFWWVTRPLPTLRAILDWLDAKSASKLATFKTDLALSITSYRSAIRGRSSKDVDASQQVVFKHVDMADSWQKIAGFLSGKLKMIASPIILFYWFAARFCASVVTLVFVFAGFHLATAKLDAAAFGGAGIKSFGDALYFSTVTFFTVGYGDVTPVSALARGVVMIQIVTALMMLTLLALSFSTLSQQTTSATAQDMEQRATGFLSELGGALGMHINLRGQSVGEAIAAFKKDPRARLR